MNAIDLEPVALAEAVERLAAMPAYLDHAVAGASAAGLAFKPAGAELSLTEQACHLRDVEREGYLPRVRRVLAETRPALQGFDGAAVAAARDYPSQDARRAASDFAAARRELVALVAALTPAQLAREATFGGRDVCLADVVAMMVEHDRGHREEIERMREARGGSWK